MSRINFGRVLQLVPEPGFRQGMITVIHNFKTKRVYALLRTIGGSIAVLVGSSLLLYFSYILVSTQLYDSVTTHLRPGKQVKYRFFDLR